MDATETLIQTVFDHLNLVMEFRDTHAHTVREKVDLTRYSQDVFKQLQHSIERMH